MKYIIIFSFLMTVVYSTNTTSMTWLHPSKEICTNNGGDIKYKYCYASVYNGKKICKALNASIPILYEYEQLIQDCGVKLYVIKKYEHYPHQANIVRKKNISNIAYQTCIKKLGFSGRGNYVYQIKNPDKGLSGTIKIDTGIVWTKKPGHADYVWTDSSIGFITCVKK